jgi:hypothetical protein
VRFLSFGDHLFDNLFQGVVVWATSCFVSLTVLSLFVGSQVPDQALVNVRERTILAPFQGPPAIAAAVFLVEASRDRRLRQPRDRHRKGFVAACCRPRMAGARRRPSGRYGLKRSWLPVRSGILVLLNVAVFQNRSRGT